MCRTFTIGIQVLNNPSYNTPDVSTLGYVTTVIRFAEAEPYHQLVHQVRNIVCSKVLVQGTLFRKRITGEARNDYVKGGGS